jgi:hypothetical protein
MITGTTNGVDTEAQREKVRARLAEIVREKDAKRQAVRDLIDDLTVRFSDEVGEVDVDWMLVTNEQLGLVAAVKRGEASRFRHFVDGKKSRADAWDLVKPNLLYPTLEEFKVIGDRHDEFVGGCALAVCRLHGLSTEQRQGK